MIYNGSMQILSHSQPRGKSAYFLPKDFFNFVNQIGAIEISRYYTVKMYL
ncbi:hypothetical protein M2101_000089 [Parabacteroides sp. PM5-20]|nr:hypothetical protein [Parabacteroides sp. PM5-20]